MSFPGAYVRLTIQRTRWQTPCGQTLSERSMRRFAPQRRGTVMDIERINLIGTTLADLTRRTEALRGYL